MEELDAMNLPIGRTPRMRTIQAYYVREMYNEKSGNPRT